MATSSANPKSDNLFPSTFILFFSRIFKDFLNCCCEFCGNGVSLFRAFKCWDIFRDLIICAYSWSSSSVEIFQNSDVVFICMLCFQCLKHCVMFYGVKWFFKGDATGYVKPYISWLSSKIVSIRPFSICVNSLYMWESRLSRSWFLNSLVFTSYAKLSSWLLFMWQKTLFLENLVKNCCYLLHWFTSSKYYDISCYICCARDLVILQYFQGFLDFWCLGTSEVSGLVFF